MNIINLQSIFANFGPLPIVEDIDTCIDEIMFKDPNWLPIFQIQNLVEYGFFNFTLALLRPETLKMDNNYLLALNPPEMKYTIDAKFDKFNGKFLNEYEAIHLDSNQGNDINWVDGVALTSLLKNSNEQCSYPQIGVSDDRNSKGMNDFEMLIDSAYKSSMNEIIQKIEGRKKSLESKSEYRDVSENLLKKTENLSPLDLAKWLINEDEDENEDYENNPESQLDINIEQLSLNQKEIKSFVREIHCRIENPHFEAIRNNLAKNYSFELDPFQKEAVVLIEQQQNVLVSAHTSAGKTVVAEYAIAQSLRHGRKTIYTSPIKALSNQKFKDFKECFDSVGIVTGDIQLNPTASCVIMTTEILRSMMYHSSSLSLVDVEWIIFDEVHYVNDEERGVVWEELLIILPRDIKLVLLSATFPNCLEFANWIGSTRQQLVNVIMTYKRPVPLEHFLYTGKDVQTIDKIHKIIDSSGQFIKSGFFHAQLDQNKVGEKTGSEKTKSNFKVESTKRNPFFGPVEKNSINSLIKYLDKNEKMPAIFFIFSKDNCFRCADMVSGKYDFTTKSEKSYITTFINKCLQRLSPENQQLPQITKLKHLAVRGLAVHHSGILPILREIVEILFQKSLIRVLFATETFAIGVNMPAKTVVFIELNKPSKSGRRDLLPSEYTQMAGRAGRRGQDDYGTVIVVLNANTSMEKLESVILAEPMVVKSRFCITYGLIIRHMSSKSEEIQSIEDLMRSSFLEFNINRGKNEETAINEIALLQNKLNALEYELDNCSTCNSSIMEFYHSYKNFNQFHLKALAMLSASFTLFNQVYVSNRLCLIKLNDKCCTLAIISPQIQDLVFLNDDVSLRLIPMIVFLNNKELYSVYELVNALKIPITSLYPYLTNLNVICYKMKECRVVFVSVHQSNIIYISEKLSKLNLKSIKDDKKVVANHQDAHKNNVIISKLIDEFKMISHSYTTSNEFFTKFKLLNMKKFSSAFVDDDTLIDYDNTFNKVFKIERECFKCGNFDGHFKIASEIATLTENIQKLENFLSSNNLIHLPEYRAKLKILQEMDFIDINENITLKGRIAYRFRNNYEIVLTELVVNNVLLHLEPILIAALLSCFLIEQAPTKNTPPPDFVPPLSEVWNIISQIDEVITNLEHKHGVSNDKRFINHTLMKPVYDWANGQDFSFIVKKYNQSEGGFVRNILRLDEICSEIENASLHAGITELKNVIHLTREKIHRDIVFVPSLYIT